MRIKRFTKTYKERAQWHPWFAWYPVFLYEFDNFRGGWAFLETVYRKSRVASWGDVYWVYCSKENVEAEKERDRKEKEAKGIPANV